VNGPISFLTLAIAMISSSVFAQVVALPPTAINDEHKRHSELLVARIVKNPTFRRIARIVGTDEIKAELMKKQEWKYSLKATDFEPKGPRDVPAGLARKIADPKERAAFQSLAEQMLRATSEILPRKNNLSVAAGILLVSCLHVLTPDHEFSDAESNLVFKAFNDAMASTPGFARVTDEQRTAIHDLFIVTGTILVGMQENAKEGSNEALTQRSQQLAREVLALFGVKR